MELPSLNRHLFSSSDADELQQVLRLAQGLKERIKWNPKDTFAAEELERVSQREHQLKKSLGYV